MIKIKLSFCISIKNRLEHIKETLPYLLNHCRIDKELEIVLLDYDSTDGLEQWVKSNLLQDIQEGTLNYYKINDQPDFLRSHARNMSFRLAKGEILCNLDADNYFEGDYIKYIKEHFKNVKKTFLWAYDKKYPRDVYGRICVRKSDFLNVKGYNEEMNSYGYEDLEFCQRLQNKKLTPHLINKQEFLKFIEHDNEARFKYDWIKNVTKIYLHHKSFNETGLLLLLNNNKFLKGTLLKNVTTVDAEGILKNEWEKGTYLFLNNQLNLTNDEGIKERLIDDYKELPAKKLDKMLMRISLIHNATIFHNTIVNNSISVNENGFGKGTVIKNFDDKNPINLNPPKQKKISLCSVTMNRLDHLKQTLSKNIQDNSDYNNFEYVLLDYNSSDGTEKWVKANFRKEINSGRLVYYKTTEPKYFHRSHSRNVVFNLAKGDVLCNLDIDNFTGKGFAGFLNTSFIHDYRFYFNTHKSIGNDTNDTYGRLCLLKENFHFIRGYDERIESYAHEDTDIYSRLDNIDLKNGEITNPNYLKSIKHSNSERVKNERFINEIENLFISKTTKGDKEVILLMKNNIWHKFQITKSPDKELAPYWIKNNEITKGVWDKKDSILTLTLNREKEEYQISDSGEIISGLLSFKNIKKEQELLNFSMIYVMILNGMVVLENKKKSVPVNPNGYGKATVYKNFDYNTPIQVGMD